MKKFMNIKNKLLKTVTTLIPYTMTLLAVFPGIEASAYDVPVGDKEGSVMDIQINNIAPENGKICVDLGLDLQNVNIKSQLQQVFTPYMYNGSDTMRFESFSITGHKRLLSNERNRREITPVTFYKGKVANAAVDSKADYIPGSILLRGNDYQLSAGNGVSTYTLQLSGKWEDWMQNATFGIDTEVMGCANCLKNIDGISEEWMPLAQTSYVQLSYFPEFLYVTPKAEAVKTRDISARAYIDFVVNRIEINPNYRRNPVELAKIRATIDSVRNDKDITITKLHISGTASPEGSYENNIRLAKGRTAALKDYVQGLYKFPQGLITTSYEPVDWQGLAQFLELTLAIGRDGSGYEENTQKLDSIRMDQFKAISQFLSAGAGELSDVPKILPHAQQILDIVNGSLEPYARNSKIRTTYPKEYDWLLKNVYPALRHSDYRIEFEIKHFTEAPEIIEVMQTQPNKLSLEELFVAANSQPEGSELYNRAFDLAVTMYPNDETANLNAAINAMREGNINLAARYLPKAGNSPEAEYAKAILSLMQGNEDEAMAMFETLQNSSNTAVAEKARAAKEGIENVRNNNGFRFKKVE